ncbi:MAG TPA: NAD(P)H-binding protein, partial [Burkholderiaceae bacterium]|nr:NAD(P)H-binding protein [Burkholderiaceae bacterium]
RTALVAGASGLVGREILRALLADKAYSAVHCVGRRPLALKHPKLHSQVVDFAALPRLPRVDDVFIALGTTIKVAGSQQAFRAIDFDAVVAVASAARSSGATHLGVVSAMGASARSPVFYNRVKGEMEQAVSELGYESVVIARPSMLAGDRESLDQPVRTGERIGLSVMALFRAVTPANLRAIAAGDVAASLCQAVKEHARGTTILLSGELQRH